MDVCLETSEEKDNEGWVDLTDVGGERGSHKRL